MGNPSRAGEIRFVTICRLVATILMFMANVPANPGERTANLYFTPAFTLEEFQARRQRLMDAIGPQALAIVRGNEGMPGHHEFFQNNNTYYLSGVEAPGVILLLDGSSRETHLFLRPRDTARELVEGPVLTPDSQVTRLTGIGQVHSVDDFGEMTSRFLAQRSTLYTPMAPQELEGMTRNLAERYNRGLWEDPWDGRVSREAHFVALLKKRFPAVEIKDLSPIMDRLRLIKSPQEIALLRQATALSVGALTEAMRSTRPGQYEYELDALGQFIFMRNGADGLGYYALVAAGQNAYTPHYHTGRSQIASGDLLLYDFGPEYYHYTADVTRMWPVNGRFSVQQRELYGFYLALYRALMKQIRPHVAVTRIVDEVAEAWQRILEDTRFSKPHYQQAATRFVVGYRRRANRTQGVMLGHWVGMAVHDVGGVVKELKPGMVLTIEPQFRVPEERIYIRLEDMLLVTEEGVENLSGDLPMEMDEIETLMQEEGLLERYRRHLPRAPFPPVREESESGVSSTSVSPPLERDAP